MELQELICSLNTFDANLTVFVAQSELSAQSDVALVDLDTDAEPDGMRELIDVWHARDIVDGISNLSPELRNPNATDQLVARFVQYLENDA